MAAESRLPSPEPKSPRAGHIHATAVRPRDEFYYPHIVAIIRLLMLTGCRVGEVVSLEWDWIKGRRIHLPDSKSGPRTVWLFSPARAVIDAIPRYTRTARSSFPPVPPRATSTIFNATGNTSEREAGLEGLRITTSDTPGLRSRP